jgi:hypothetical protein
MKRWQAVVLFLYALLVGSVLLITPWTRLWEVSVFAHLNGFAGGVYRSFFFRLVMASLGAAMLIVSEEVYKKFIGRKGFLGRHQ